MLYANCCQLRTCVGALRLQHPNKNTPRPAERANERERSNVAPSTHWFKAGYTDFLEPLCEYLCRFVPPEAAEDLAHEAFLRVYTVPNFESIRSPRGYLFRTARNLALNAISEHGTRLTEAVEEIASFEDERASVERQAMMIALGN